MYISTKATGVFVRKHNQQPYKMGESIEGTHLSTFQYRIAKLLYRLTLQAGQIFLSLTQDTQSRLGQ